MSLTGDEFDSFWDLSSMISSKKKKKEAVQPQSSAISTVVSVEEASTPSGERTISVGNFGKKLICRYVPEHSPFLLSVNLYRLEGQYSFYSSFREDALRYFEQKGQASDPVPYFSYIPQYAQMSKAQLNFYFYFREKAKEGEFVLCDVTYFWLYIYEIINLPDKILPKEGVKRMCLAWAAFRDRHPKIDKYMTVWLADYCLVNALPCPTEYIGKFLPAILEHAGFKEFYLGHAKENSIFGVHTLLSLVSTYQWQKSKFILSLAEQERRHILNALIGVIQQVYQDPSLFHMADNTRTLSRGAYSGSLCGHNIKCKIEVVYHPFQHEGKLSQAMTAAVKYAENKMRIYCGQKSRLTVGDELLPAHKTIIDGYFEQLAPKSAGKTPKPVKAEYEKQYDAEDKSVSFSKALSIECDSWENTRKLVEDIDDGFEWESPAQEVFSQEESVSQEEIGTNSSQDGKMKELLSLLLEKGSLPFDFDRVALCEEINSRFMDEMGDIVITLTDTECVLIEDYREEIEAWIKAQ